jgi:4-amino-4-deoxy-L-arabinose transferase-like glycosyltransferase
MRSSLKFVTFVVATYAVLIVLHFPLLRLPYFWDEAGYYIPSALDFYRSWTLTPHTTLPEGHPPLVIIYLGLAWRIFGYSALVARAAMTLVAASTVATLYVLARRISNPEIAAWSAVLLALSPLFFAQSTLAHLDLAAALFTTLAVLFLLADWLWLFALAGSLAVLSKETAVVLLPVAWLYAGWFNRRIPASTRTSLRYWIPLAAPILPLAAWTLFYHHTTGYWIGNRGYLSYNVYSTLSPARVFWSFLRRAYELFLGGFNWLLTLSAPIGIWWGRKYSKLEEARLKQGPPWRGFIILTAGLIAIYLLLLSVVGGAILPRYLLPVMPLFYLAIVAMVARLPRFPSRLIFAAAAACFVAAWFINPPYPFPFEDNLAYADFIRLHQDAAHFLAAQPNEPRILTAWPASDELAQPFLGYVQSPLRVVIVPAFEAREFAGVQPDSFDLLYLYSRRWEPPGNWLQRYPAWLRIQGRYFDYQPQSDAQAIVARYHLHLVAQLERHGQWVKIYSH